MTAITAVEASALATQPTPRPRHDPLIVGITGRAGAGKDTLAEHLVARHGFVRYAFADPLKAMLEALFAEVGIASAWMTDRELKERMIPQLGVSSREMLQRLGTEWGRQMRQDFWLKAAEAVLGLPGAPVHDRIVITDVRFPNEAAWLRGHEGVLWRVRRHQAPAVRWHESEAHSELMAAHAELDNCGALWQLHEQADELMRGLAP